MRIVRQVVLALLTTAATGCFWRGLADGPLDGLLCRGRAGFVWTQGSDTLGLERVTVRADVVTDYQIFHDREVIYRASVDSALTVVEASTGVWSYEHAHTVDLIENGVYQLEGDTAWSGSQHGPQVRIDHDAVAPRASLMVSGTIGLQELIMRRARRAGRDSVDIPTFYLSPRAYAPMAHVRFIGRDSARIRFGTDSVVDVSVDRAGRIMRAYYPSTSVVISRVKCGVVEDVLAKRKKSVEGSRP